MFSFLNFKDMLDIIDIVNIKKGDNLGKLMDVFSSISCEKSAGLYSLEKEYLQNIKIRRLILDSLNLEGISNLQATQIHE